MNSMSGGATIGTGGAGVKMGGGSVGSFEAGPRMTGPISMPKADVKPQGPINLKNGFDGNHARSESLAFKSEVNKSPFNLEQKAVKFNERAFKPSKKIKEQKVNKAGNLPNDARLAYTRQELGKLIQLPTQENIAKRNQQIAEIRMLTPKKERSELGHERVRHSYDVMVGKAKAKSERKVQSQQEVKAAPKPDIRTTVSRKVKEALRKMSARVEAKRQTKAKIRTEVRHQPFSTEKYQQVVEARVNAKLATRPETKIQIKTQAEAVTTQQPSTKVEVKPKTDTKLDVKSEVKPVTSTEKQVEEAVENEVVVQVKQKEGDKVVTEKKIQEDDSVTKYVYIDRDTNAEEKRKLEGSLAYIKAYAEAKLLKKDKITGADVYRFVDKVKFRKTQSKSIDGIETDGTVEKSLGHIAHAGEIVSLRDMRKKMDEINEIEKPTEFTEDPTEQLLGAEEAREVHNGKDVFYAWKDGQLVKVKLMNRTYTENVA